MGGAAGYQVADYLLDRLGLTLRQAQIPESFWEASCLLSPAAARRIGEAAQSRLRYGPAARLYARACEDVADVRAAERLSRLCEKAGRYGDAADILWPSCYAHFDNALVHATAGVALTINMARAGELDWLIAQADAGDDISAKTLADALAEQGNEELLLARARAGDDHAGERLARMWRKTGRLAEAIELLWSFTGTGAISAPSELAEILVEQDRSAEAIEVLTQVADTGHEIVKYRLAELLADADRTPEALLVLESLMLEDDPAARKRWVDILARTDSEGTLALLRAAADQGNADAARELARLLAQDRRIDEATGRYSEQSIKASIGKLSCCKWPAG
jgi:thioredoxin-like negative regulator of GroEL